MYEQRRDRHDNSVEGLLIFRFFYFLLTFVVSFRLTFLTRSNANNKKTVYVFNCFTLNSVCVGVRVHERRICFQKNKNQISASELNEPNP